MHARLTLGEVTDPSVPIVPGNTTPRLSQLMPAPTVEPRRRSWVVPVAVGLAVVAGLGVLFALRAQDAPPEKLWTISQPSPTPPAHSVLRTAQADCKGAGDLYDNEKTLVLDLKGDEPGSGTVDIVDFGCILNRLQAPAFVIQEMNHTRALDGRQQQTWGNLQASWTYHPDNGLDVIIRDLS